jgi:hypothetical protein
MVSQRDYLNGDSWLGEESLRGLQSTPLQLPLEGVLKCIHMFAEASWSKRQRSSRARGLLVLLRILQPAILMSGPRKRQSLLCTINSVL